MSERSATDRGFANHDAFENRDEGEGETKGYVATATPFEARATARGRDRPTFEVTVRLPTLPAVVAGEVGHAVADGWYETLTLRLEDAYDVTRDADGDLAVRRNPDTDTVRVTFSYSAAPRQGVDDAAALVDYVEGTYVQGVIPGYDYEEPVAGLLARARENAQAGQKSER